MSSGVNSAMFVPCFLQFRPNERTTYALLLQLLPNAVNQPAGCVPNHRQQKRHNIDKRRHLSSLNRPSSRPTVVLISAMFWCIASTRSFSDLRSSLHSRSSAVNQIHIFPTAPLKTAPSAVMMPKMTSADMFTFHFPISSLADFVSSSL